MTERSKRHSGGLTGYDNSGGGYGGYGALDRSDSYGSYDSYGYGGGGCCGYGHSLVIQFTIAIKQFERVPNLIYSRT